MPPIVKENETLTATTTATPSAARISVANSPEAAARPQPVALEVPVSVNGARTVEGSDKREPFSENTKTVLVFGNGAVIRLTSNVAPGQLLFLTNDKTKKEVVCQVVKSKNYRNVSGYVELEFTEPVVGFWGMRFPNDRIGPQSAASVAAGPVLVPAAAPKVVAPAVPAPVAAKPVELKPLPTEPVLSQPVVPKPAAEKIASPATLIAPPAPPAVEIAKQVAPAAAIVAPPTLEEFMVSAEVQPAVAASSSAPPAEISREEVAAKIDTAAVADSPKLALPAVTPVEIAQPTLSVPDLPCASDVRPVEAVPEAQALELPVASPAPVTPSFSELSAALTAALTSPSALPSALTSIVPPPAKQKQSAPVSSDPSMEELKQETARLQQQLAALLFTELPVPPPAPALDSAAVAATTNKLLEIAQAEPAPLKENKPAVPARPLPQPSLGVEEVKIPAWLEPLARNTPAVGSENVRINSETQPSESAPDFAEYPETDEASVETSGESTLEAPSFGSRLLLDQKESDAGSSGGSKTGLWIGIAAGILLLAGGAAWYLRSTSNSSPTTVSAASQPAAAGANSAAPIVPAAPVTSPSSSVASSAANVPAVVPTHDAAKAAPNSSVPASTLAASTATPQPQPVPEQPKKPVMGNVRLAAPVMNRKASKQDISESAPELNDQGVTSSEGLGSMTMSNGMHPAAPLPVGGDVKPAILLNSLSPIYPSLAKTQHVNGDVKIDALIDATGHVTTMKVLSGPTLLHQSAMGALKQWRYQPATLNGNPVPMHLTVTLQFRLQ